MSDAIAVSSLVARMNFATDSHSADKVREVWAEDGRILFTNNDGSYGELRGREAILGAMEQAWSFGTMERHIMSNPDIQVDGDEATAHYYVLYSLPGSAPVATGFGEYHVRARKDADGRWWVIEQEGTQHSRPSDSSPQPTAHLKG